MNLFERLKPEVLASLNKYADMYPISGGELIEALVKNNYIHNLRYGHAMELLGTMPFKKNQSPYDLFH